MKFEGYTHRIFMVRPSEFRKNEQTAVNNYFQQSSDSDLDTTIQAQLEFDALVNQLRKAQIEVIIHQDTSQTDTPDALFPNNWVSFHTHNRFCLYPMFAYNRRLERQTAWEATLQKNGIYIHPHFDWTSHETDQKFLEGTGSLVLDRVHRIAYAALSERTHPDLVAEFCSDMGYTPICFTAYQTVDTLRKPIYHTNVMMAIGPTFAVVCLDSIDAADERHTVEKHLLDSGKEIIAITEQQLQQMAGNMICLHNQRAWIMVMSSSAYQSLHPYQLNQIQAKAQIVHSDLSCIEQLGGGSARCMIAEIF